MTIRTIVQNAFDVIGVTEGNETISAGDAAVALRTLNMLLDQWSIEQLMVHYRSNETFTLTASTGTYSIGADDWVITDNAGTYTAGNISAVVNGTTITTTYDTNKNTTLTALAAAMYTARTDILTSVTYSSTAHTITCVANGIEKLTITTSTASITGTTTMTGAQKNPTTVLNTNRPIAIESAFVRVSSLDYPIEIITNSAYQRLTDKSDTSSWPDKLHYVPSSPLGTIHLLPIPASAYTLGLTQSYQLVKSESLDTVITLPPGYNAALTYNLSLELCPRYGKAVSDVLAMKARETKANIKRVNQEFPIMQNDYPGSSGGAYNINIDE